jgi:hypothetical protein
VASNHDFQWHRSVFSGQPFAISLVWGYNAREQEDWRMYEVADGTFSQRGIRRLKT